MSLSHSEITTVLPQIHWTDGEDHFITPGCSVRKDPTKRPIETNLFPQKKAAKVKQYDIIEYSTKPIFRILNEWAANCHFPIYSYFIKHSVRVWSWLLLAERFVLQMDKWQTGHYWNLGRSLTNGQPNKYRKHGKHKCWTLAANLQQVGCTLVFGLQNFLWFETSKIFYFNLQNCVTYLLHAYYFSNIHSSVIPNMNQFFC